MQRRSRLTSEPSAPDRGGPVVTEAELGPWRDADGFCHVVLPHPPEALCLDDYQANLTFFLSLPKLLGLTSLGTEALPEIAGGAEGSVCLLAYLERVPRLPEGREWLYLEHQAGGYSCAQRPMIATRLRPGDADQAGFDALVRALYYAENGWFADCEHSPASCVAVQERLGAMGFVAAPGIDPCEAFYPVAATTEALQRLDPDPADILPLLENPAVRPVIVVLSNNSD